MKIGSKHHCVFSKGEEPKTEPLEIREVTRLEILSLFSTLIEESDDKLEEMDGVQKIIDRIFEDYTKNFFYITLAIFIGGFVVPFCLSELDIVKDEFKTLSVCSITMIYFGLIELSELMSERQRYFT